MSLARVPDLAGLIVDEGREIVYTRGKDDHSERHYRSERTPLFDEERPMVILVDNQQFAIDDEYLFGKRQGIGIR